ncbi:MAG: PilW family protein [Deltaproteobacteria bacterium]|nr:PilW family protein [Deltaproteobacteria bacterium]
MIYQTNSRYYYRQQSILEQEQNLRAALYIMSRDVRMAGDGLIVMGVDKVQAYVPNAMSSGGSWFIYDDADITDYGIRPIFGGNSATGPDTLTIFRTAVESSVSFAHLASSFTSSANKIFLSSPIQTHTVAKGDVIGLAYGRDALLLSVEDMSAPGATPAEITLGERFKPGGNFPEGLSFPEGTYVYNLRDVFMTTYWVDTAKSNLMARYHHLGNLDVSAGLFNYDEASSVIVAPGIEDLQVRYVLTDEEPGPGSEGLTLALLESTKSRVRQVHLGLVSRSGYRQPGNNSYMPVTLFDHSASPSPDGYLRQVMTQMVNLRNY